MNELAEILVAEDDEADVLLLQRAFREAELAHPVRVVRDGQEAIDVLLQREVSDHDRMPALIILDLKMPRRSGMEVLKWIREHPALRCLPVLMFSSSAHRDDIERSYTLGANGFIVKPASTVDRTEVARFIRQWLKLTERPIAAVEGFRAARAFIARDFGVPQRI